MPANGERDICNASDIRRRDIILHSNRKRLRFKAAFVRRDRNCNSSGVLTDYVAIIVNHGNARVRRCDFRTAAGSFLAICRCELQRQRERIANSNFRKLIICDFPRSRRLIVQYLEIINGDFSVCITVETHVDCCNGISCTDNLLLTMCLDLTICFVFSSPL